MIACVLDAMATPWQITWKSVFPTWLNQRSKREKLNDPNVKSSFLICLNQRIFWLLIMSTVSVQWMQLWRRPQPIAEESQKLFPDLIRSTLKALLDEALEKFASWLDNINVASIPWVQAQNLMPRRLIFLIASLKSVRNPFLPHFIK